MFIIVIFYRLQYVHIHVCIHVCMHAWMHACMYVCMYVCMHACMSVCMHASMHACIHVCIYVCMYVCLYVCMSACLHVCIYVCMYVWIDKANTFWCNVPNNYCDELQSILALFQDGGSCCLVCLGNCTTISPISGWWQLLFGVFGELYRAGIDDVRVERGSCEDVTINETSKWTDIFILILNRKIH